MTSLLPPRYLSRTDLERCSSVRISRYIISVPSRYSCNSVLRIYLLILSRSCSVRSPTSVLRTPAYSPRAWTSDLRPLGPPQIEGTDGVSGRWLITSPELSPVSAELRTGTPGPRTPRGTVLTGAYFDTSDGLSCVALSTARICSISRTRIPRHLPLVPKIRNRRHSNTLHPFPAHLPGTHPGASRFTHSHSLTSLGYTQRSRTFGPARRS